MSEEKVKKKCMPNRKEVTVVHVSLEQKTYDDLGVFCRKKNVSKSVIIHKALKEYMKLGTEFNVKIDKLSSKAKEHYIRNAIEWYLNEQKS